MEAHARVQFLDQVCCLTSVRLHHLDNSDSLNVSSVLDINECDTNNGGCAQICTNTPGSRVCSCRAGFTLASDGTNCEGKTILIVFILVTTCT